MEITTYDKHLKKLYNEFPDVDEESIKDIVRYGLRVMSLFRSNNHDIYLNNNKEGLYYYFGDISKPDDRSAISEKKIHKKLRLVYSLSKPVYDGYFYFSISQDDYEKHLEGKPIDKVVMYKVQEEAKVYRKNIHLFRFATPNIKHWTIIKENYETTSAEYIQQWNDKGFESCNDAQ